MADMIRENAFVEIKKGRGKEKIPLNVSPEFIDEYLDRIFTGIEVNIQAISEYVYYNKKRKTLMVKYKETKKGPEPIIDDVTDFFSVDENNSLGLKPR